MQIALTLASLAALWGQAAGHYGFPFLVVDGVVSKRWEYIRPTKHFDPLHPLDYTKIVTMCGLGGETPIFPIKTAKVAAGDAVGFGVADSLHYMTEHENFSDMDPKLSIWHPGPATAWMSKAPGGDLDGYKGDDDWFKIDAIGGRDGMHWDISDYKVSIMNFTIPAATPPGKYLLRAEHFNVNSASGLYGAQLFVNCAHIEVTGSGTGTPGPVTRFPGAFDAEDPGIWLPHAIRFPMKPLDEIKNWQGAGPAVWRG